MDFEDKTKTKGQELTRFFLYHRWFFFFDNNKMIPLDQYLRRPPNNGTWCITINKENKVYRYMYVGYES